jgi:hypothetical protein
LRIWNGKVGKLSPRLIFFLKKIHPIQSHKGSEYFPLFWFICRYSSD